MKDYTVETPTFSNVIKVTERTDPALADLINMAPMQLLQNTLYLYNLVCSMISVQILGESMILSGAVGARVDGERLYLPDSMAYADGETMCLTVLPISTALENGDAIGTYTLPIASDDTVGGVKVGSGLNIDDDGLLTADLSYISEEDAKAIVEAGTEDMTEEEVDEAVSAERIY